MSAPKPRTSKAQPSSKARPGGAPRTGARTGTARAAGTAKGVAPSPRKVTPEPSGLLRGFARLAALRPDLSGPGLRRLSLRTGTAALVVTLLAVLADWSSRGLLSPQGLDKITARSHAAPVAPMWKPR